MLAGVTFAISGYFNNTMLTGTILKFSLQPASASECALPRVMPITCCSSPRHALQLGLGPALHTSTCSSPRHSTQPDSTSSTHQHTIATALPQQEGTHSPHRDTPWVPGDKGRLHF